MLTFNIGVKHYNPSEIHIPVARAALFGDYMPRLTKVSAIHSTPTSKSTNNPNPIGDFAEVLLGHRFPGFKDPFATSTPEPIATPKVTGTPEPIAPPKVTSTIDPDGPVRGSLNSTPQTSGAIFETNRLPSDPAPTGIPSTWNMANSKLLPPRPSGHA
jgi:hypothetical protein